MLWIVLILALLSEPSLTSKDPQRGVSHKQHILFSWGASGFCLHEPMWSLGWFHMNTYELCNQTSHMDCFNACLPWQKLGPIKWQGGTPCMTYKMAQGVKNAGWQKQCSIKWQGETPCIHHKTWYFCCGHCRCSLLALCCSKCFLGFALLLRCLWLLFAWAYVKPLLVPCDHIWTVQPDKPHGLLQCMPALAKARAYKMTGWDHLHDL